MKNSLTQQLRYINERYGWLGSFVVRNMRLILLLLFAGLATYLVVRINSLVNSEVTASSEVTPSPISKKLDKDVLTIFNELSVQEVQLDSNFDEDRDNPF